MEDEHEAPQIVRAADGPSLARIAERVLNRPLLLHPTKVEILMHVLQGRIRIDGAGLAPLGPEANRFVGSQRRPDGSYRINRAHKGVALITIEGSLVNRGAWIGSNSGLVSYEGIAAQVRDALADDDVTTILLDLDSPGGEATGAFTTARLIAAANKVKPVVAFVDDMAASAAYALASAASEIVVSPTSLVGSIGVVLTHLDRSGELEQKGVKPTLIYAGAHKVDGNPFGPLSDAVRADLQAEVVQFYDQFVALVAEGRGARLTEAMARATEARTFVGADAIGRGLADRIASLDDVLADLSNRAPGASHTRRLGMSKATNDAPQVDAGITTEAHAAAVAAARAEGAAAERARIAGILSHAEAEGRAAQAQAIALETDMTADQAAKVLAASPKGAAVQSIEDRARGAAEFGGEGDPAPKAGAAADAAWDKALKRVGARR